MNTILFICISAALLSVLVILTLGIFSMTKGGEFNKKYGNKLMRARVIAQALAIVFVAAALFLAQK